MYIFGFGSLVNKASAQKSFKRVLKDEDFIPVILKGYGKVWNSIEHVIFENEKNISNAVFLNLEENKNLETNGILLKITEEEFKFLKIREKNYSCIELTEIEGFDTDEKIYTFMTTKKDKIATLKDSHNCFIPKRYIELLENGLEPYSENFRKEFIKSYSSFPFQIKDGSYIFSDPIQNKFAKDGISNEK